jgi:HEAT repeat protein
MQSKPGKSEEFERAEAILKALPDDFEGLAQKLSDQDPDVRCFAAYRLMRLEDRRAVEPLLGLLEDESARVRFAAALGLGHYEAPESVPRLLDHLENDPDPHARALCASALDRVGGDDTLAGLIRALGDPDWHVKSAACSALARRKDSRAASGLIGLLDDPLWNVRHSACQALVDLEVADERVVSATEQLRREPEAEGYEDGMAAVAEFVKALITEPRLAETIEEFDGRKIEPRRRALLRAKLELDKERLKEEPFPEMDFSLEKLAERARKLLNGTEP